MDHVRADIRITCKQAAAAILAAVLLQACLGRTADGHASDESYVWVNVTDTGLEGRFELRFEDLRRYLGVAIEDDPEAALDAMARTADRIQAYLLERFSIEANGTPLQLNFTRLGIADSEGPLGLFAQYWYRVDDFDVPDALRVRHTVLLESGRNRRGLLCMESNAKTGETFHDEFTALVFSELRPEQVFDLTNIQGLQPPSGFVRDGALAMVRGLGHSGFLLALLIPTVVLRSRNSGRTDATLGTALVRAALLCAAFSLGHVLTLGLAGLSLMSAPSALVEAGVLGSVAVLAVHNVRDVFGKGMLLVVFTLGLFHGMSLAADLEQLTFRMTDARKVLLGFTAGAEVGQAALALVVFPVAFALRRSPLSTPALVAGASIVALLMSATAFMEYVSGR